MRKTAFANEEIYHVYNRGVEKRDIFMDENDYFRFTHDLFEFNDTAPALPNYYKSYEIRSRRIGENVHNKRKPRNMLVHILAFCLMPNHFHLLLLQKQEGGISEFLKKIGIGYTLYFNQKYKRSGVLFQGKFKAVPVERDAHFIHLPYYIHANPLDIVAPEWREGTIKNRKDAFAFLEHYRWSSFPDYIGQKNFPSVTQRELLLGMSNGESVYKSDFEMWLKSMQLSALKPLTLE